MGFLCPEKIVGMGFLSVGENPKLSDKASYYGCDKISIGDNVRIDDFCVVAAGAAGIFLGNHIHLAVYSSIIGAGKVSIGDFSGLSSRVSIYSSSDDYSGFGMTNPTVPTGFTNVNHADVVIGRHVIIGSGSVVLPGVTLHEGVAVGALSLVSKDCAEFGVYSGVPARRVKERSRNLLQIEQNFLGSMN